MKYDAYYTELVVLNVLNFSGALTYNVVVLLYRLYMYTYMLSWMIDVFKPKFVFISILIYASMSLCVGIFIVYDYYIIPLTILATVDIKCTSCGNRMMRLHC